MKTVVLEAKKQPRLTMGKAIKAVVAEAPETVCVDRTKVELADQWQHLNLATAITRAVRNVKAVRKVKAMSSRQRLDTSVYLRRSSKPLQPR